MAKQGKATVVETTSAMGAKPTIYYAVFYTENGRWFLEGLETSLRGARACVKDLFESTCIVKVELPGTKG